MASYYKILFIYYMYFLAIGIYDHRFIWNVWMEKSTPYSQRREDSFVVLEPRTQKYRTNSLKLICFRKQPTSKLKRMK